jgi:hypothetical protein
VDRVFKGEIMMSFNLIQLEKTKKIDKTMGMIILCHEDEMLRKLAKEKTTMTIWIRFKKL